MDQLGGLFTWGQGSYGRCGHGVGTDMPSPARVESLSGLSMSQVALGLMHSVTKLGCLVPSLCQRWVEEGGEMVEEGGTLSRQ